MKADNYLGKEFEFKIVYWALILLSTLIVIESFLNQQLPSVLYFIAVWVSLPLQTLFLYSVLSASRKPIDNSDALTIYAVSSVLSIFLTNPYSPFAIFWFLIIILNAVLSPIVLIWSGMKLFNPKQREA
jgi:hypothetical protein